MHSKLISTEHTMTDTRGRICAYAMQNDAGERYIWVDVEFPEADSVNLNLAQIDFLIAHLPGLREVVANGTV